MADETSKRILVWDLPTRLFHWGLVLLLIFSFVSGEFSGWLGKTFGGRWKEWHFWSGYAVLALLIFRIAWGFVGGTTARFSHFVRGPGAAVAYLRGLFGPARVEIGHNPVGGAMVVVLILAVLLQAGSGLFTSDDIDTMGPLAESVSSGFAARASTIHRLWYWVLLALIAVHVSASLFYWLVKRQNLVGPMINGHKVVPSGEAARVVAGSSLLAAVLLAAAGVIVYVIVRLGG